MTEITIEDGAVNVTVQNQTAELGEAVENIDITYPGLQGLLGVNVNAPLHFDSFAEALSISQADSTHNGYISASDWNVFNNKLSTAPAAGSNGYLQFNNSGAFGADSGLFWDNTNKRHGIGTAAPSAKTHIASTSEQLRLENNGSSYASLSVDSGGNLSIATNPSTAVVNMSNTGGMAISGNLSLPYYSGSIVDDEGSARYTFNQDDNEYRAAYYGFHNWFNGFGTKVLSLDQTGRLLLTGNINIRGVAYSWPLANPGSGVTGVLTNNGIGTLTWGANPAVKTKVTATDVNTTITAANTFTLLPTPTANRTLTLPAATTAGQELIIWNKSISGTFTWSFAALAKDAASATITTLANNTIYRMISDGSSWIRAN